MRQQQLIATTIATTTTTTTTTAATTPTLAMFSIGVALLIKDAIQLAFGLGCLRRYSAFNTHLTFGWWLDSTAAVEEL